MQDLQKVFEKGKGKKVTQEALTKLLELIAKSEKTQQEVKELLMSARDPAPGKLNLDRATKTVEAGELPELKVNDRKYDVDKATSNYNIFQQLPGRDPRHISKKTTRKLQSNFLLVLQFPSISK